MFLRIPSLPNGLSRRAAWGEVIVVLAVAVVPNLTNAMWVYLLHIVTRKTAYWWDTLQISVMSACFIYVTLYLIRRNGESWEQFGIVRPRLLDVAIAIVLFALVFVVDYVAALIVDKTVPDIFPKPVYFYQYFLMVIKFGASAFSEELVTRAYLVTRLAVLLRSRTAAVFIAAIAFGSYHIYQGVPAAVWTVLFGILFGFAWLMIGRIWPLVIAHALVNCSIDLFG